MTTERVAGAPRNADLTRMPLVWMYHSIAIHDEDPYEVTMTPQRFEKQLRWLHTRGLRGVAMGELLQAQSERRAGRLVGLTFDDGYQDFLPNAMPLLHQYGFTATLFVLAGRLGGENTWSRPGPRKALLTADEVREIDRTGIEIGSHGLEHVSLIKAGDAQLKAETSRSREILEELLGKQIRGFCYPYGHLEPRVVDAARVAGYDYACAVGPGPDVGLHAIPRTLVHDRDTSWRLEAKRAVWRVTIGNRHGVRRYRRGQ